MSDTPNQTGDSDFDFDDMASGEDPFAGDSGASEGEGDPFDFSEGEEADGSPPPPKPASATQAAAISPKKKKIAKAGAKPPGANSAAKAAPAARAHSGIQAAAGLAADTPVQVVAVMGKKNITVGDLISLKKGQVIELNRFPNEAVDLVANGKLMAKGELVEIDGKLGVRIIKIFE